MLEPLDRLFTAGVVVVTGNVALDDLAPDCGQPASERLSKACSISAGSRSSTVRYIRPPGRQAVLPEPVTTELIHALAGLAVALAIT